MTFAARRLAVAVPAVVVTVPLLGFSLQGDERRSLYRAAARLGSNPLEALGQASPDAGSPPARGNLGPLGRILESLQHAFAFETAEAAGLAPHVVQGAVRVAMVAAVAVAAGAMISAVMRSAGADSAWEPARTLFPLALGAVLVAGGASGPMTRSSFVSVGAAALVLSLVLLVARDRDMQFRAIGWSELAAVVLLGAAAAATHGLVWVAPAASGGLVVARAVAAGQPPRWLLRTAALRRWAALSAGVVVGFVVQRAAAAGPCGAVACFEGSALSVSGDAAGLAGRRLLSGAPPAGWSRNASIGRRAGLDFGPLDLVANSLLAVLVAVVVVAALSHGRRAASGRRGDDSRGRTRAAAGLAVLGVAVAAPPALLAGLSGRLQSAGSAVGEAWSDTLLVQVGWSLVAAAVIGAAATRLERRGALARTAAAATIAAALGAGVFMTLLANERLAHVDRRTPLAAVVSEISEFTVIVEAGDSANALRCGLIDTYTQTGPDPSEWAGGPQLRADLDRLMNQRHGWPFCDPARLNDPDPS